MTKKNTKLYLNNLSERSLHRIFANDEHLSNENSSDDEVMMVNNENVENSCHQR